MGVYTYLGLKAIDTENAQNKKYWVEAITQLKKDSQGSNKESDITSRACQWQNPHQSITY